MDKSQSGKKNISQIKNKGDLKTYISLILMTLYIGAECRQVRE